MVYDLWLRLELVVLGLDFELMFRV